jgi:hypothetical protein
MVAAKGHGGDRLRTPDLIDRLSPDQVRRHHESVDGPGAGKRYSGTPATWAMPHISTVDGYTALPPGTYTPTRRNGLMRMPSDYSSSRSNIQEWRFW